MGVSRRHVVMIGVEVGAGRNPHDPAQETDAYDEWMDKYRHHDAMPGNFVYFEDYYGGKYAVFGKLLEMSADERWDAGVLEFAPRHMSDKDWLEVKEKTEEVFQIKDADPKLYVFTHLS